MDYRRNEGFIRQPSSSRLRDPYETMDRGNASSHHHRQIRRSVSPQGLPQETGSSQRNGSVDMREFDWAPDRRRAGRARSRSPQPMASGDTRKRPHYDNGVGISPRNFSPAAPMTEPRQRRGGNMAEPKNLDFDDDGETEFRAMRGYGYEPRDPRTSTEDLNDVGFSPNGGEKHQLLIAPDSVPPKVLAEGHLGPGGKIPPPPRAMDSQQQHYEQGRLSNRPVAHPYHQDGEKPVIVSRDVVYHMIPGSNSKGFASSSSEVSRRDDFLAYQDSGGHHLPQTNEFKGGGGGGGGGLKLAEPAALSVYRERDPEGSQRNPTYYVREYSPDKGEQHENYFYVKSREVVDERGYPAEEMHKVVVAPRGQLDYGRTQIIYDNRDLSRASIVIDRSENPRQGVTYYRRHPVERQTDSEYHDMRRTPHVLSKQAGEYMGPSRFAHVEYERTGPEDHEFVQMGLSKGHRISDLEPEYVFEDDVGLQFREERLMRSPTEMNRHNMRMTEARDVHRVYKPQQERLAKGKFTIQEGASNYNPRKNFPGKVNSSRQFEELQESGDDWINEETGELLNGPRTRRFQQPGFRRNNERKYEPGDRGDFESDEWFSSQEIVPQARKNSVGFHKPYYINHHIKGNNRRPGYVNHYNSQQYDRKDHLYRQRNQSQFDRRNHPYRQHNHFDRKNHQNHLYHNRPQKMWKRNEGYHEDTRADNDNNDSDPSEDRAGRDEPALPEDSEEFKQRVHTNFLEYSEILNGNSGVKRRYKEEGKAGSLFCIVCGRSASKEFMDTRRLVTHAFMSHKSGLRANHLGLHRAICVLLGWSTVIPDDTITWLPQLLSKEQALAQKEDLIIWPPVVVIHNVSLSNRNPEKRNVINADAIEAFVRSKGVIRGRIKVVLGKPADQSVMVVKFLGTFTGLGDAEKLHKYFVEKDRGRVDLEIATQKDGEISINKEAETLEENILYGYLGISEDLERVDFKTRNNKGSVRSRNDILDLANDPVKKEET